MNNYFRNIILCNEAKRANNIQSYMADITKGLGDKYICYGGS